MCMHILFCVLGRGNEHEPPGAGITLMTLRAALSSVTFDLCLVSSPKVSTRHTQKHMDRHTLTHLKVRAHILSTQTLMNLEHKLAWVNRCRITLKKQLNRSSPALPLAPSKPCKNSDPKPALFLRSFYWRNATWVTIILHLSTHIAPQFNMNASMENPYIYYLHKHCALVSQK